MSCPAGSWPSAPTCRSHGSASGLRWSRRRTAGAAESAGPVTTTSARTWSSLRHRRSTGRSRSTARSAPSSPTAARLDLRRGRRPVRAAVGGHHHHAQGRRHPGSSILIAGAGPIGIICAQTARAFGAAEIIVTDLVPERRRAGAELWRHPGDRPAGGRHRRCGTGRQRVRGRQRVSRGPSSTASRPSGRPVRRCWSDWAPGDDLPIEHIQNPRSPSPGSSATPTPGPPASTWWPAAWSTWTPWSPGNSTWNTPPGAGGRPRPGQPEGRRLPEPRVRSR